MAKCAICKTTWTTSGMSLCPICGAKVEGEASAVAPTNRIQAFVELPAVKETRSNGSAPVAKAPEPPPPPRPELPQAEPPRTEVSRKELPRTELRAMPDEALSRIEMPLIPAPAPPTRARVRPQNGPLILGFLALVAGGMLPATLAFESHRIAGILGFCASGFFLPFGPIAWLAGMSAEKRRREQGLRPETRVVFGRVLGQLGTLLIVIEVTAALFLIAGLRLSGKLPLTFRAMSQF